MFPAAEWATILRVMRLPLPLLCLGLFASAACGPAPTTCDVETANGLYRVVATPDPEPIPFAELFALDVTITDANAKPVSDATLTFEATMPAHGHGMQTQPTIEALGDGSYRIDGMKFHMRGTWTLTFGVDASAGADTAACEEAFY